MDNNQLVQCVHDNLIGLFRKLILERSIVSSSTEYGPIDWDWIYCILVKYETPDSMELLQDLIQAKVWMNECLPEQWMHYVKIALNHRCFQNASLLLRCIAQAKQHIFLQQQVLDKAVTKNGSLNINIQNVYKAFVQKHFNKYSKSEMKTYSSPDLNRIVCTI